MLVEVQCDEFKSYGEPRKAIRFHYGLNAVIGDDNGSNSIGKSTFQLNSYTFSTPNDGGTGAQYRGLVTFDLANMEVAPIPFVVHDSPVLKHIERPVFSRIMEIYASQAEHGKQVFMAYDTLDAYGEKTLRLVEKNTVLELSPNGNELFGWAWNKKDPDEEEPEETSSADDDSTEGNRK